MCTSTFKLVLSKGAAVIQPGMQKEPLPMFRSTMIGVRSRRTAYAARICVNVDLPWSVGPTTMTCSKKVIFVTLDTNQSRIEKDVCYPRSIVFVRQCDIAACF